MNRIYISLCLIIGGILGGCKDELNVYPTTQQVDGNIIKDEKSATTVLNGVYYRLANGGADVNGVPSTRWYEYFEVIPSQLSGMLSYSFGGGGLDEHVYNAKTSDAIAIWNYGNALVNAANGFLKNLDPVKTIPAAIKARMTAEARFLRACGNAQLLLFYGQFNDTTSTYGIILRDEFVQPTNLYPSRATVAESYAAILADLEAAIPDLPDMATSKVYANVWVALLLEARLLINRGGNADYAKVISLTKNIIANSPFTPEASTKDIFWSKGLSSNEVMLGIQPYATQNVKWTSEIYSNYYSPNNFMKDLFSADPRAGWYMQQVETRFGPSVALTKYYPGSVTNVTAAAINENGYAFRLTEAYLLQAEAIVASGGSLDEAKVLLKEVMEHAGYTDFNSVDAAVTAEQLQLLIIKEEMKNFVGEAGQDWFAVRRLPFATLQGLLPSIKDKSLLLLPVPDAEIIANKNMAQNPNY
ncbi:RagB/SusD family nutrient uptake outer membrane protein [Chitinophaga tropicalis]|uniref:RagB/SusD family nutrient uptake outer membrane protein n=1 Tax=Chitinophaga tropicalis TaxID=2683588 RepID=A0A7K1U4N2_9BACT|nr:RagB/SusD family nutrient uptake outer membrane protein [Chitinophaga tropicalis]MVT09312.1 RagB/SusD family nutrient uptake outer membrane protein [Chitinophaga tropicalis]